MRPTALFIAYLGLGLISGALLAYPAYLVLTPAIDEPMYRFVTRGAMLVALVGLIFFLRFLRLNDKQALGYALPLREFTVQALTGLVAGVLIMLPLVLTLVALDIRVVSPDWGWPNLAFAILEGLVTGLLVAVIEETFFRGAMFTAVDRHSGLWPAAVSTSLLYAALHFLKTDFEIPPADLEWYSGLLILPHLFEQYASPANLVDSFLALFAVGMFLALVRAKTGSIATCIGLHAGWVFAIQLTKDVTDADYDADLAFLVGRYDGVIGYLAFILIVALAVVYYRLFLGAVPKPVDRRDA